MRILGLIATGQPEANLESTRHFLDNKSQIDKISILSTEFTQKSGITERLKDSLLALCNHSLEVEVIDIPHGYEESNMWPIQDIILDWVKEHPAKARFIFNVTGGTKLMSLALDRASQMIGANRAECFYQSRDHKIVWYQRQNDKVIFNINKNLNLQQRVSSRGYEISKQQLITDIAIEELQYAQILINLMQSDFQRGRRFCSFINKLAAIAKETKNLTVHFPQMGSDEVDGLSVLAKITNQHFFSFDESLRSIEFKNEYTREYMKGGWLEVYTGYECFKALMALNPQAELAINVELTKDNTPNEMDVMFIHQAYLYCIECKTAKTMADNKAQDVLYKLASLQGFGGLNQKRAVVSLYPLQDYNLSRAQNSDIYIFQETDLLDLESKIKAWLQA
ncbi:DUF1887 family CARF protein [Acinetobacter variabilis]|uniref:Card1-like endonuclease domain-containing protein n=1 Tax=Acinetobacter variabilis TaxID=70346 RepID=UPI003A8454EA